MTLPRLNNGPNLSLNVIPTLHVKVVCCYSLVSFIIVQGFVVHRKISDTIVVNFLYINDKFLKSVKHLYEANFTRIT